MRTLLNNKAPIWTYILKYINIFFSLMAIYIINIMLFPFNITIINSFILIIWTYFVMDKASLVVYNLHIKIMLLNNMSSLLSLKKDIPKTI